MMKETYLASCRVWAGITWMFVVMLIVAAWAVMLVDDYWKLAFLLGGTACALSAVAATLHIRSFIVRICSLIRATAGVNSEVRHDHAEGLHPVR